MRKLVMIVAVLLCTGMVVNANTIISKAATSKEVKMSVEKKHKKHKKSQSKSEAAKPANSQK